MFDFLKPKRIAAQKIAKRIIEHHRGSRKISKTGIYEIERIKEKDEKLHKYVLEELTKYGYEIRRKQT